MMLTGLLPSHRQLLAINEGVNIGPKQSRIEQYLVAEQTEVAASYDTHRFSSVVD